MRDYLRGRRSKGIGREFGREIASHAPEIPCLFPFKRLPLRLVRDISSRGFVNLAKRHERPLASEGLIASEGDFACGTRSKYGLDQKFVHLLLSLLFG